MAELKTLSRSTVPTSINPHPPAWQGFLEAGLGGAGNILREKADKVRRQEMFAENWETIGFPRQIATGLAMSSPDIQSSVLMQYMQDPEGTLQGARQSLQREQPAFHPVQPSAPAQMAQLSGFEQPPSGQAPQQPLPQQRMAAPSPLELLSQAPLTEQIAPQGVAARGAGLPQMANLQQQPASAPQQGLEQALQGLNTAIAGSPNAIKAPETNEPEPPPLQPQRARNPFEKAFANRPLGPKDIASRKLQLAEQKEADRIQEKEQSKIDKQNEPWIKAHEKKMRETQEAKPILEQLREDWESGKVISGVKGKLIPDYLLNEQSGRFRSNSAKLASFVLGSMGIPTNAKLKFVESLKTSLTQPHAVQGAILENLEKALESNYKEDEIYQQLLAENNGHTPPNLAVRVRQEYSKDFPGQQIPTENVEKKSPSTAKSTEQEESLLSQAGRFGARTASRIAESAVGAPGDILGAASGLTKYATGGKVNIPNPLPTSGDVKGWISEITGGVTDPQGPWEKILDDVIDTAASLAVPGKGAAAAGKLAGKLATTAPKAANAIKVGAKIAFPFSATNSWKKALAQGAAGEAAAKTISALGGEEGAQAIGKIALMTAMGTHGTRKTLDDTMKSAYEASRKAGDESAKITTKQLHQSVKELKNSLSTQIGPDKAIVNEIITDAEKILGKKKPITINDLVDVKKKINEWIGLGYKPKISGEKYLPKAARTEVERLNKLVSQSITKYGLEHPKFGKPYAIAEEIYKGFHAHDQVMNFIKSLPGQAKSSGALGAMYALYSHPTTAFKAVGAGLAAKPAVELVGLLQKSPHARAVYARALKHAAENNIAAFTKDMARLDKEMA